MKLYRWLFGGLLLILLPLSLGPLVLSEGAVLVRSAYMAATATKLVPADFVVGAYAAGEQDEVRSFCKSGMKRNKFGQSLADKGDAFCQCIVVALEGKTSRFDRMNAMGRNDEMLEQRLRQSLLIMGQSNEKASQLITSSTKKVNEIGRTCTNYLR